ncbi:MAG: CDP-alcohol phosphatidyltransferase family protein [Alphaproteobacteria bacterium]|nr:CDP-alcohol phosphatidyltransferase family protein [Alphaproteobacteria bacterium]
MGAAAVSVLPNLLSWLRLLAAPAVVWLLLDRHFTPAFWLFLVAGLSDLADGWLAKRLNAHTEFGARLDPVADKALVGAVYFALGWIGLIPLWLVVMVVARDIAIVVGVGVLLASRRPLKARPLTISKVNTGLQLALVVVVLARAALDGSDGGVLSLIVAVLVVAAAGTTALSWWAYAMEWSRIMATRAEQAR